MIDYTSVLKTTHNYLLDYTYATFNVNRSANLYEHTWTNDRAVGKTSLMSTWIECAQLQEELNDQTELDNFVEYIDDRSSTCVETRIIFQVQYFNFHT